MSNVQRSSTVLNEATTCASEEATSIGSEEEKTATEEVYNFSIQSIDSTLSDEDIDIIPTSYKMKGPPDLNNIIWRRFKRIADVNKKLNTNTVPKNLYGLFSMFTHWQLHLQYSLLP